MQAWAWPFSPSLTGGGLDLPTGCRFTSWTSSLDPASPAALVSSYNPKRQEHCRAGKGPNPRLPDRTLLGCLSLSLSVFWGRGGLLTLAQCPRLKLVQYKTSQFIVFLDINIDSG